MRGLLIVLKLFLVLQGLDEGFLRQILRVRDIAHDVIDLGEDTAQVLGDEAVLTLRHLQPGLNRFTHPAVNGCSHRVFATLLKMTQKPAKRGNKTWFRYLF
jgi:hypothetical protein